MKKKIYYALCLGLLSIATPSFSQETEVKKEEDIYILSLEELMNIPINSASKKDETVFDAPLSSYTITRSDIDRAGSTSIMEALRLAPGVIVREQTNGVYDIHIRGFDNLLRNNEVYGKSNLSTLVMIDNRPVFNNNLGGTFWEALPVDINDVERIEIVRGPSAPLFGPNAVTGVINIITKRVEENKTLVSANVQGGTPNTIIANASAGKSFGKFSLQVSANYQKRDRFDDNYYLPAADAFYTVDQLAGIIPASAFGAPVTEQYANPKLAMNKWGANAFLNYKVSDKVSFDLSLGSQQSEVQKVFLSNVFSGSLPFTVNKTNTSYVNLAGKIHGFSFRSSYLPGKDNLAYKTTPNQYDYDVFDATGEYSISLGKIGSLVPGVSYQSAVYDDKKYNAEPYAQVPLLFLNGQKSTINTSSAFLRSDLKLIDALRIIAALRVDKFSSPDKAYLAYEFATTYKINKSNLIRAAVTRSNSGSFIGNNDLNLTVPTAIPGVNYVRTGSNNLDLFRVNMIEFGYRSQLSKTLQLDIDVFQQKAENLTALLVTNGIDPGNGTFAATEQKFLNVPTTAIQQGLTFSLNYVPNEKIQFKPFFTVQKTETKDLASSYVEPGLANALGQPVNYSDSKHKNTPSTYGGYYLNFKPSTKFNLNSSGYFFAAHRQYDGNDTSNSKDVGNIKGKFIVNLKAAYSITRQLNVFVNARNLLNTKSREFYGTDRVGGLYTIGASFNLN